MKTAQSFLKILALLSVVTVGISKPIEISKILILDDQGEDSTFQEIPELQLGKKILCLWNGDNLQAFFIPTLEDYKGDIDGFLKAQKKSMSAEGAKKIKIEKIKDITNKQGTTIQKFYSSFVSQGQSHKSIFYIIPLDGVYQMVSVTVTSPDYFDDISRRADALFAQSTIKG